MKKFNILLMGVMALGFVACNEPAPTVPPVQQNPQGPVMETTSLTGTASGAFADGSLLNLQTYQANPDIPVLTLGEVADMPEGGSAYTRLELSSSADFTESRVFEMTMNGNNATVNANELNEWHILTFGKSPVKEQRVYYRVPGYIMLDGTDYRVGSSDTYAYVIAGSYKELCYATDYVIEDAYYMLSDATGWTLADAPAFAHNSEKDVYDAPEFTYTIVTTQPNCQWQVAPQSAVDGTVDNILGVVADADNANAGTLVAGDAAKGVLKTPGKYLITINMEAKTYTVKEILYPDMLAARGGWGGWSTANASWLRQAEDGLYKEAVVLDGKFKFVDPSTDEEWVNATTWGMGVAGELVNAGGSDIEVTGAAGTYWAIADLSDPAQMTYELIKITSVGVVGVGGDWNQEAPIELTPNASGDKWSGDVELKGTGWKIVINHSWDYNYGGTPEDPHFNWGNFFDGDPNAPSGTYTVTFDLTGNLPKIELVQK